ncbi:hypothetical protein PFICI_02888 [Pestalotiopsis fici W106-1]|uniref:Saccharopine dehydrogenase NADP binding domain-containing protein n=1 Tax=Pestalotiopsis fici (strain W106-1 / CGMCC3.15140) TaxID=1229662 RepID=W3XFI8_PESFW|nr:uncharacterized protein PFICI_02888 [Pestalotiopsis fici W106-1]ETS84863.1 hypothetical protein PFICI_02888 [Pestalotiopsis fici W106-1]
MAPKQQNRQYELILLGATGYTGALTADHIARHLPTNLRWAIAGRSRAKLEDLAAKLQKIEPNRVQPEIEVVLFDRQDKLDEVVRKAQICISVVTYCHVGDQVVKACVENGTDYVDTAGGVVQFGRWFSQYHEKAKAAGVALIHACGAYSAPHDLLAWLAVRELKREANLPTKEVILAVKQMSMDPSGGTVESMFSKSKVDSNNPTDSDDPWFLSPTQGTAIPKTTNMLGVREVPYLGLLSAATYGARQDRAIVHRTWGLLDNGQDYGVNFRYSEYASVSSTLHAVGKVLSGLFLGLFLSLGPLARLFLPREGEGPDLVEHGKAVSELEAVALADGRDDKKAVARFRFPGGPYYVTAAALAQGAASLLYKRELEGGYQGGNLTPACLGDDFVDRLRSVGTDIEVKIL